MTAVGRPCTVALAVLAAALAGCTSVTPSGPSPPDAAPTTAELPTTAPPSTGPPASPGPASSSVDATRCRSSELTVSLGATEGAAGSVYRALVFTNKGSRGLLVYPPGETAAIFVPLSGTGCAGTPSGPQLTVQAITAS